MKNIEISSPLQTFSHALMAQVTRDYRDPVDPNECTITSRSKDITRINLSKFFGLNVCEEPQKFV